MLEPLVRMKEKIIETEKYAKDKLKKEIKK